MTSVVISFLLGLVYTVLLVTFGKPVKVRPFRDEQFRMSVQMQHLINSSVGLSPQNGSGVAR